MLEKKTKINMLKLKVKFQETENNYLKNEINYEQALTDSILKPNSNLLKQQCCHFQQHKQIYR